MLRGPVWSLDKGSHNTLSSRPSFSARTRCFSLRSSRFSSEARVTLGVVTGQPEVDCRTKNPLFPLRPDHHGHSRALECVIWVARSTLIIAFPPALVRCRTKYRLSSVRGKTLLVARVWRQGCRTLRSISPDFMAKLLQTHRSPCPRTSSPCGIPCFVRPIELLVRPNAAMRRPQQVTTKQCSPTRSQ